MRDEATSKAIAILDSRVFGLYAGVTAAAWGGNMELANEMGQGLVHLKGAVEFLEGVQQ